MKLELLSQLMASSALTEAASKKKPTFTKYTDFSKWNDENGGDYSETEIDGKLVGVLHQGEKVIGLWYNRKNVGSISKDFAKINQKYGDDPVAYSELDPTWPWSDIKESRVIREGKNEYEDSAEFTNEMSTLIDTAADLKNKLGSKKMAKWMKDTDDNFEANTAELHDDVLQLATELYAKMSELMDELDAAA